MIATHGRLRWSRSERADSRGLTIGEVLTCTGSMLTHPDSDRLTDSAHLPSLEGSQCASESMSRRSRLVGRAKRSRKRPGAPPHGERGTLRIKHPKAPELTCSYWAMSGRC